MAQKKTIYVDNSVSLNSYEAKQATLRAVGTYCNVWIVDDYYADSATGAKTTTAVAKKFADKFDSFYPKITHIFGNESNNIIYSGYSDDSDSNESILKKASNDYPMSQYSDTGDIVNIVLYDIGNDYGKESQCNVLGYFYSKDYFSKIDSTSSVVGYSNQGKYFYIDSYYANEEPEMTISTLAHEFQHMVNFGVKNIDKGLNPDTAYNEMLSMLCEDMMAQELGLSDSKSVKAERLPTFNTSYFLSGICEYRDDDYAALSYSTSYGFGSWLCRQYGGATLVKNIMSNAYIDNDSLVAAVNTVKSTSYTFDDLFQQFLVACTTASGYTHNQNADRNETYSTYTYPMTAIDLWGSAYKHGTYLVENQETAAYDKSAKTGPFLFSNAYGVALHPEYGITLHKLGKTDTTGSLSLTFTDTGADCVTMYVIIE